MQLIRCGGISTDKSMDKINNRLQLFINNGLLLKLMVTKQTDLLPAVQTELAMNDCTANNALIERKDSQSLSFQEGALTVLKLSYPLIITSFCSSLSEMFTYSLAGHLGSRSLSALGLGVMITRILSSDILFSLSSGYDTMGSQSFGKGEAKMVGIYLYRALIIIHLIGIPTYFLILSSDHVLLMLGVTSEAAELASEYANIIIPNTILVTTYGLLNKFLIVQRIVKPQMYITAVTASLQPCWVYLFAFVLGFDFRGIGCAYILTNTLNTAFTLAYIKFSGSCVNTLPPFDKSVFKDWLSFLKVAVPSGVMLLLELDSYIILCIFSGSLGVAHLAANQALCNLHSFNFSIPVGIGSATCALVGNSLGNQNISQAKHFAKLSVLLNSCVVGVYIILAAIFKTSLAHFYSKNDDMREIFEASLMFVLFSDTFDTTQGILCRVLIAMARQPYASLVNLIVYFA